MAVVANKKKGRSQSSMKIQKLTLFFFFFDVNYDIALLQENFDKRGLVSLEIKKAFTKIQSYEF